ncbi:response regulator [Desulfobacterales bacterium HSG2]|nr:response regulator [Desulfobacterales bacterium HSG2]
MSQKVILCVDDEEIILTSLRDQLQNHFGSRYMYEFAESADEALEVISELNEDGVEILIIVSDWLMPEMKGDEFLIRVHKQFPGIVKVMLTGHANEEAIERTRREANLHRCLYKPWDEEELIETLVSGLGN